MRLDEMQNSESLKTKFGLGKVKAMLANLTFGRSIHYRNNVDRAWRYVISIGGIGVIVFVMLIMFFLMYVVVPLFAPATVSEKASYVIPGPADSPTLFYELDEYKETGIRVSQSGVVTGFNVQTGKVLFSAKLNFSGASITSFTQIEDSERLMAFGLSNGQVQIIKFGYTLTYPNDKRLVSVHLTYPFGKEGLEVSNSAIQHLAVRLDESELTLVMQDARSNSILVKKFEKTDSFMSDDVSLELSAEGSIEAPNNIKWLRLGGQGKNLYLITASGKTFFYNIANTEHIEPVQTVQLTNAAKNERITSVKFLLGSFSLMIGTNQGRVIQWFPVRGSDNLSRLQEIRHFDANSAIEGLNIEHNRKGFVSIDADQNFTLFYSTSERKMATVPLDSEANLIELSPRSDGALVEQKNGQIIFFDIENEYPEVSFYSLWDKVWYEGYDKPSYVWQSSSASADYEPKFSMVPLTFGTLKAALYSMLFAIPIAILAAIYTAFFMNKQSRAYIKPIIELIEALPTVILGFLAGLWLAPYMEAHLSGFFAIFFILPLGILLVGFGFSKLPDRLKLWVPMGARSLLMIPVVLFLGWLAMVLNNPLQEIFFHGDMRHWLTASAGIDFDQRNAMVIGFAMGFALIPTIFSVAEDALYNVPAYLVNGSLALGASGWQTIVGVVLPTASPGIFSAIMLGFGRGVGETMIVLMASGNTPLMDANLFEGMRTLAANLAVEMGEAELYSTHYRVLFLSGLLLFIFTFIFNSIAEVVRERMRKRYGSL